MKQCRSWCRPDGINGLIGIKRVDITVIREMNTVIPQIFQEDFPSIAKLRKSGQSKMTIQLKYNEKIYEGYIEEDFKHRITIGICSVNLKETIKNIFIKSLESLSSGHKLSNSSTQDAEYIEFYSTDQEDMYEIKLINNLHLKYVVEAGRHLDINLVHDYLKNNGFNYTHQEIYNFYLSLKSKPFVILSGISGTGKSKLVRLFAEAIGANFTLIPVRPDWSDATELLGYKDINQVFHPGKLTEVIAKASDDPDTPYIVCLDEMNLARVEYYFSDFLSLIELRHWKDGRIVTDPLPISLDEGDKLLSIPDNLYIVGTVNMDETTFQFSKKVLDRANTIELNDVDLAYNFEEETQEVQSMTVCNNALRSEYLLLRDCKEQAALASRVIEELIVLNEILTPCQMQFAYRVRDEVVFYMAYNEVYDLMSEEEAFDYQILQKVLPRINGTSTRTQEALVKLFWYCVDGKAGRQSSYDLEAWQQEVASARYPKSSVKLLDMLRRFEEDGFTSFWF